MRKEESNPGGSLSASSLNSTIMFWSVRGIFVPSEVDIWQPARESNFMNSKSRSTKIRIFYYQISK